MENEEQGPDEQESDTQHLEEQDPEAPEMENDVPVDPESEDQAPETQEADVEALESEAQETAALNIDPSVPAGGREAPGKSLFENMDPTNPALHDDPLGMAPFLSDEFVLWLWYMSEYSYSTFTLQDDEKVDLWIDDRLTFLSVEEKTITSTFKGGAPSTLPEAKLSILSGKRIGEAKIGIRRGEAEWSFTLKVRPGEVLVTGLKVPSTVKDDFEEMIYERMYLIDSAIRVIEDLFTQFFRIRTSDEWGEGLAPAMRLWLMGEVEQ